jgi:hypothetical protein
MYTFPKTTTEIRRSGSKFFQQFQNEPKDSATRAALNQYDYESLGNNQFQRWLSLDDRLNELNNLVREVREQRDTIWDDDLREPLQVAKKIITICNPKSAVNVNKFGFESKPKTANNVPTERKVKNDAERLAANVNALREAKAVAQKPSAMISVTVNDLTKSTNPVGV